MNSKNTNKLTLLAIVQVSQRPVSMQLVALASRNLHNHVEMHSGRLLHTSSRFDQGVRCLV